MGAALGMINGWRQRLQEDVILPRSERVSRELLLPDPPEVLDFSKIFGNQHPLELEIGTGKGYFLTHAALQNPMHNYLGIEIHRKYLKKALDRVEKRPLPNVRLIYGEAFHFMEAFLPRECLTGLHIYFPDPWPKKRHHKRRLFSPEFLQLAHRVLKPGGLMLIATDHQDYWERICEVLENQDFLVPCEALPEPPEGAEGLTNYEIKYIQEGRPIHRAGYRRAS